ncbi:MAG: sodium:proton antiporter, partial [Actinomycetia bacterium]|nr:sodium:proton antiporter [Actinomycetes bacterium]
MIALLAAETIEESTLIRQEIAVVILLAIAAAVAVLAKHLRFPYTVALVLAGFGASTLGDLVAVEGEVSPQLILALLVPPLLFEATLHLPWAKLRADLAPIMTLALVGTTVGTFALGALVHYSLDLPWAAAFAFGALISATDPVAVVALFKELGAPQRLGVLVEGESLLNDATAIVVFTILLGMAVGGAELSWSDSGAVVGEFLRVFLGGALLGGILGVVVSEVLYRLHLPLAAILTMSVVLAYV